MNPLRIQLVIDAVSRVDSALEKAEKAFGTLKSKSYATTADMKKDILDLHQHHTRAFLQLGKMGKEFDKLNLDHKKMTNAMKRDVTSFFAAYRNSHSSFTAAERALKKLHATHYTDTAAMKKDLSSFLSHHRSAYASMEKAATSFDKIQQHHKTATGKMTREHTEMTQKMSRNNRAHQAESHRTFSQMANDSQRAFNRMALQSSIAGANIRRNLQGAAGGFGVVGALQNAKQGILGTLSQIGGYGVLGGLAGGGAFAAFGLESQKFKENMLGSLDAMLKSKEAAVDLFEYLQEFADVTPFEMDETVQAGQQLLAFGFDVKKMLPVIGDAAFAMKGVGVTMEQVVHSLAFARAGLANIRMLAAIGVNKEDLAKFGVRFHETGEIVAATRRLVLPALEQTLTTRFGGTMEKLAKSFEARWTTALSNVRRFAMAVTFELFESFKSALGTLNELFKDFFSRGGKDWDKGLAIMGGFRAVFDVFANALENAAEAGRPFLEWLAKVMSHEKVKDFLIHLAANLEAIRDRLIKGISGGYIDWAKLFDPKHINQFFETLGAWVTRAIGWFVGMWAGIQEGAKYTQSVIQDFADLLNDKLIDVSHAISDTFEDISLSVSLVFVNARISMAKFAESVFEMTRDVAKSIKEMYRGLAEGTPSFMPIIKAQLEKAAAVYERLEKMHEGFRVREHVTWDDPNSKMRRWQEGLTNIQQDKSFKRAMRDAALAEARLERDLVRREEDPNYDKRKKDPWKYITKAYEDAQTEFAKEIEARKKRIGENFFPTYKDIPPAHMFEMFYQGRPDPTSGWGPRGMFHQEPSFQWQQGTGGVLGELRGIRGVLEFMGGKGVPQAGGAFTTGGPANFPGIPGATGARPWWGDPNPAPPILPGMPAFEMMKREKLLSDPALLKEKAEALAEAFDLGYVSLKDWLSAQNDLTEGLRRQAAATEQNTKESYDAWNDYLKSIKEVQSTLKKVQDGMLKQLEVHQGVLQNYIGLFPENAQRELHGTLLLPFLKQRREALVSSMWAEEPGSPRQTDLLSELLQLSAKFQETTSKKDPFKGRFTRGGEMSGLGFLFGENKDQAEWIRSLIEEPPVPQMTPEAVTAENTTRMVYLLEQLTIQGNLALQQAQQRGSPTEEFRQNVRRTIAEDYQRATARPTRR